MRTPLILISLFLIAGCATAAQNQTDVKAMPDAGREATSLLPAELGTAHAGLLRAWQGKDPLALRPYYAEDAIVVTRSDRFQGWAALHAHWLTPLLPQLSGYMAMPNSFKRMGDVIHEQGRYSYFVVEAGREREVQGVYAHEWKQQDNGHWRIVAARVTDF
jgi:ketosteroid isomerase-like protein